MRIRAVLETEEVRSDKSQMKPESIERFKGTLKRVLEEANPKWKVESINFLIIAS